MPVITVPMDEAKNLINYTIDNNLRLEEEGKFPIAISLEATAGIGKTSIIRQIAEDRGMTFVKLNMAQLEEPGDLIGFPIVEYECQTARKVKNEKGEVKLVINPGTVWLSAKQMENMDRSTYRTTGKHRTGYAKPAWVPEYNEKGTLILLDDYVRANPQLLQACMDLILEQKYVSWSAPKKTTFVLTNNPDDGTNNVNSLDEAQRSRFMNYEVEWNADAWAKWAEQAGVDGRCINFVMCYSNELFNPDNMGNHICNPRSFTMFADMIAGIKDWENPENLAFIRTVSRGCFKDANDRFGTMFTSFIRNKMHLLIQPKEMLTGGWEKVENILTETLFDSDGTWRSDLASLLERRFTNYVGVWLKSSDKTPIDVVKKRVMNFLHYEKQHGKPLFNKDMFYHMLKTITSENRSQTNKLLLEPEIAKIIA